MIHKTVTRTTPWLLPECGGILLESDGCTGCRFILLKSALPYLYSGHQWPPTGTARVKSFEPQGPWPFQRRLSWMPAGSWGRGFRRERRLKRRGSILEPSGKLSSWGRASLRKATEARPSARVRERGPARGGASSARKRLSSVLTIRPG